MLVGAFFKADRKSVFLSRNPMETRWTESVVRQSLDPRCLGRSTRLRRPNSPHAQRCSLLHRARGKNSREIIGIIPLLHCRTKWCCYPRWQVRCNGGSTRFPPDCMEKVRTEQIVLPFCDVDHSFSRIESFPDTLPWLIRLR